MCQILCWRNSELLALTTTVQGHGGSLLVRTVSDEIVNIYHFQITPWANAIAQRPSSACLPVCMSVNMLRKSLLLPDKWLDRDKTCTQWSSAEHASRVYSRSRSRSKLTWYQHIWNFSKIASSHRICKCILTKLGISILPLPFDIRFSSAPQSTKWLCSWI